MYFSLSATNVDNVSILIPNYDFPLHNVVDTKLTFYTRYTTLETQ
jgi:hypothetical protein